jgi:aspartate racemase
VNTDKKNILGILGGIGPLASAEFLRTIYDYNLGVREQEAPLVVMYSDPSFLDRTEAILRGSHDILLAQLIEALHVLRELRANRIVICCFTVHYLLPRLPDELRKLVASLLDVVFAHVARRPQRHLLMCTNGARRMELFQKHSQWEATKDYFVLPAESDQLLIHELIYQIKKNQEARRLIPTLEALLLKYKVDSFIAGCTELHLLAKHSIFSDGERRGYSCIDPLSIIARGLREETL